MKNNFLEDMYKNIKITEKAKSLFMKISKTSPDKRHELLKNIDILIEDTGLTYALLALYRQQVNCGFVLADPIKKKEKEEKSFFDQSTGITFRLQWNPDRELRKQHDLLIERGVIAKNVDENILINKDKKGKACYLCKTNIYVQNPGEILLKIELNNEKYFAGANFAYITNNHFTIMSAEHRPQLYRKKILKVSNDFLDMTNGYFRTIFNGLAGASIEEHEHLQATTEKFPIEEIKTENKDIIYENNDIRVSQPTYYIPVWLVEGSDKVKTEQAADNIIKKWHGMDEQYHTENLISTKIEKQYRVFIILRDKRKLAGIGKKGAMAAFEAGGNIVLSYDPKIENSKEINERETFLNANLESIKLMLHEIAPDKELTEKIRQELRRA